MEVTQVSINGQMDKEARCVCVCVQCVCAHTQTHRILLKNKKEGNRHLHTIDGPSGLYAK